MGSKRIGLALPMFIIGGASLISLKGPLCWSGGWEWQMGSNVKKVLSSSFVFAVVLFLFFLMTQRYKVMDSFSLLAINKKESSVKDNRAEFVMKVREALVLGEPSFIINYYGTETEIEEFVTSAVEEAFIKDDTATTDDFDYLRYKYRGMQVDIRGFGSKYKVAYQFTYLENREQTQDVNKHIQEILKQFELEGQTEYDKIKKIHDFIITNSVYDMSTNQNTAYYCLIKGTSACQGYAALTYKMMVEAGIPCRIISGSGLLEPHAWNIVKLDGLWYNIDCTWDDPVGAVEKNYIGYNFFLKSNEDFMDHTRDLEYNTEEFNQEHRMARISYDLE